jgi:hypothetical protein
VKSSYTAPRQVSEEVLVDNKFFEAWHNYWTTYYGGAYRFPPGRRNWVWHTRSPGCSSMGFQKEALSRLSTRMNALPLKLSTGSETTFKSAFEK